MRGGSVEDHDPQPAAVEAEGVGGRRERQAGADGEDDRARVANDSTKQPERGFNSLLCLALR